MLKQGICLVSNYGNKYHLIPQYIKSKLQHGRYIMLYAFSLDDTLFDTTTETLKYLNMKYGRNHTIKSIVYMQSSSLINPELNLLSQLYGVPSKEIEHVLKRDSLNILKGTQVIPVGREYLNAVLQSGHEVVYITSRDPEQRFVTNRNLKDFNMPYLPIFFTKNKAMLAKELGVDMFYDNSIEDIKDILSNNIACRLIDSIWNRQEDLEGVIRKHWNWNIIEARSALVEKIGIY